MWIKKAVLSRRPDEIVDIEKVTKGAEDLDKAGAQCLLDWQRSEKIVIEGDQKKLEKHIYFNINGEEKSFRDICEEYYEKQGVEFDGFQDLTKGQLENIWKEYLIDKAFPSPQYDDAQREMMLDHFKLSMHQGGYPYVLQSALWARSNEKGLLLGGNDVVQKCVFSVRENNISMKETVEVKRLRYTEEDGGELKNIESPSDKSPLMIATAETALAIGKNKNGKYQIRGVIKNVTLKHNSEITKKKFDERDLWQKIVDFFDKVIFHALKTTFYAKEQKEAAKVPKEDEDASRPHTQ